VIAASPTARLTLRGAGVARGARDRARWLVRGVDLELRAGAGAGELLALVGPNGAGKTTLLRLMAGVWAPGEGSVLLDGADLGALPRRLAARRIAYVPQSGTPALDFSVLELVAMGRYAHQGWLGATTPRDLELVRSSLARCDALHLERRSAARLSGGELQRVLIARCLAAEAEILVLDEPTANLDVAHVLEVMELLLELARSGHAVAMALHDLALARRYADRVAVLAGGSLVATGPATEVLGAERIEEVFGVRAIGALGDRASPLGFELSSRARRRPAPGCDAADSP
jgi:iron complex transport system ATP-binding protein